MTKTYRKIPSDLLIVLLWTIMTFIFVMVPTLQNSIIRTILGIPMVLFIPGYVLIAALFTKKNDLESVERIALSFGLSIAVVPLLGLMLNFTYGIRLIPILFSLIIYAIVLIFIASYRRGKLPEDERFSISFSKTYRNIVEESKPKNRTDAILTIVLIITAVIAIGMIYYVITTPKIGERFTEFYVLDSSGKADNYSTELKIDQPFTYLVGVSDHEYGVVNYTIQMSLDNNVLTDQQLTIGHNQTWERNITIIPNKKGTDMKLEFWLFKENNFTEPYRELHLWVNSS